MCRKSINIELDIDTLKFLNSIVQRKRENIKKENMGMVDVTRKEIISHVISEMLMLYGNEYLIKLKNEYDDILVKSGYRTESNKDKLRKILGIGDVK